MKTPPLARLLFFALLLGMVLIKQGTLHAGFPLLLLAFAATAVVELSPGEPRRASERLWRYFPALCAGAGALGLRFWDITVDWPLRLLLALAAALSLAFSTSEKKIYAALFLLAGMSFFFPVWHCPHPFCDVFVSCTIAVDAFLRGISPYIIDYPDIYHGAYGYQAGYFYFPGIFLFQAPFRFLGDVRYAQIFCLLASAGLLAALARARGYGSSYARILALVFLFNPLNPILLEQGWADPIPVFLLYLASYLWAKGRRPLACLSLGGLLITKHYAILTAIQWLKGKSLRGCLVFLLLPLAIGAAFLAAHPHFFLENVFFHYLRAAPRPDALSFPAWWHLLTGEELPLWLGSAIGFGLLAYFTVVAGEAAFYLGATALFLFAKLAFLNYYWYASALLLLSFTAAPPQGKAAPETDP